MRHPGAVLHAIWNITTRLFAPWRRCKSARYRLSLWFVPCLGHESIAFLVFRYLCAEALVIPGRPETLLDRPWVTYWPCVPWGAAA